MAKHKSARCSNGFTIVELIIVIVIVATITSFGYLSYGNYTQSLLVSQIKSDLNTAANAMENQRNFGANGYPISVPTNISSVDSVGGGGELTLKDGIIISGGSSDAGDTYCIEATSTQNSSLHYYIDSLTRTGAGAQAGTCIDSRPIPQNLTATVLANDSIRASWDAVIHATGYTVQRDTNPAFPSPTIINVTSNSSTSTGLTPGVNYYYRVNATVASATSSWSDTAMANTSVNPPSAPVVAVTLSGSDILATATPITCSTGTPQYSFNNRTNDGTWVGYSAWSTSTTANQPATDGVKYGYQAQSRCYVNESMFSSSVVGAESTYIKAFATTPSQPVASNTEADWASTTFSWNATTCPGSALARYQYDFTTSYGYDSGWISTANTSAILTTSSAGYTYTVQVKTQCYTPYAQSSWSTVGSTSYYRPYKVDVLVIAGGGGGGAGDSYGNGGGGGAGGYIYQAGFEVAKQAYSVTVGGGGGGASSANAGGNGGNSVFSTLTAIGGGGGGGGTNNVSGFVGGSGGGASASSSGSRTGSNGTAGQGNKGGNSCASGNRTAGGGGGATGGNYYFNGGCLDGSRAGDGGTGYVSSITGSDVCYSAGGGGGIGSGTEGYGGTSQQNGGGIGCGAGRAHESQAGDGASANTGSGGGGGKGGGGAGGSGIVIIRYPTGAFSSTGGNSSSTVGTNTVVVFTGSGTFTIN